MGSREFKLKRTLIDDFGPFWFVTVMGTGISADILHAFPYDKQWLRICSYIMFTVACILFITLLTFCVLNLAFTVKEKSLRSFCIRYLFDLSHNVFWGTLSMGMITIINYIFQLAENEFLGKPVANHIIILVYILWWINVLLSLASAWGVSFCIWLKYSQYWKADSTSPHLKTMQQNLQSVLLLPVVPLFVVTSSSGVFTMSACFGQVMNRNIQLITLGVTSLLWFNALIFSLLVISTYIWNLYVNKIPSVNMIFTMFLVVGPMGQGSYGILLLTDNMKEYIEQYYQSTATDGDEYIIKLAIQCSFKVCGVMLSLLLIANGIFFTILSFAAVASCLNTSRSTHKGAKIYTFHKGWWTMTFPLGTMALGTKELYQQYNQYVPLTAFKVVSAIYSVLCICITITCIIGTIMLYYVPVKAFSIHILRVDKSVCTDKSYNSPKYTSEPLEYSSV
ncbi:LANO_0C00430g1_1 [Lachancea nothofagi CBS 11611]|uniref:LANO_0C00430g1_1 n=1 Tax=Lachancea nothofagi CBS 11611 TaxID=1266666 RepID=A0A1G4J314_9SACH|nr:LANO_0C00430g1_1 [Lachancea nothofagi CBS 11611]